MLIEAHWGQESHCQCSLCESCVLKNTPWLPSSSSKNSEYKRRHVCKMGKCNVCYVENNFYRKIILQRLGEGKKGSGWYPCISDVWWCCFLCKFWGRGSHFSNSQIGTMSNSCVLIEPLKPYYINDIQKQMSHNVNTSQYIKLSYDHIAQP